MCKFKTSQITPKYTFKTSVNDQFPLLFSFKYFNEDQNCKVYYTKKMRDQNDFYNFMLGCKKIVDFTWKELKEDSQFHCHEINNGFKFSGSIIQDFVPLQIRLPGNKQGRIVGFIDEKFVFNVVKFDKEHQIYKDKTR